MGDSWDDGNRRLLRSIRKFFGFPASRDVGIIGKLLRDLRIKAESRLSIKTSYAAISIPHIVALYMDDVEDASEYAG